MNEVSQFENAKSGETYDFHYTMRGWGKQGQIENLVNRLDQDPRWKVLTTTMVDESSLVIRILIVKNPFPLVLIVGAIAAIGTGIFLWLSLDKIEKISESPMAAFGLLGLGLAAAFFVITKARSR